MRAHSASPGRVCRQAAGTVFTHVYPWGPQRSRESPQGKQTHVCAGRTRHAPRRGWARRHALPRQVASPCPEPQIPRQSRTWGHRSPVRKGLVQVFRGGRWDTGQGTRTTHIPHVRSNTSTLAPWCVRPHLLLHGHIQTGGPTPQLPSFRNPHPLPHDTHASNTPVQRMLRGWGISTKAGAQGPPWAGGGRGGSQEPDLL